MIKKISFAIFLAFVLIFAAGAIQAGDVNADDVNSSDDTGTLLDDDPISGDINPDTQITSNDEHSSEKNQSKLTSPTSSVYYNGNYKITLTDSNTTAPLANRTVYFSINDVAYSAETNSKGVASFNLKLNPGTYLTNAYFMGDDTYGPSNNLSCNVKVLTTIKASDVTKYYKGSKAYKATYLDSNGKPLKNKKVTITVNGKKYTKKTDSKGTASFPIDFKPGTYKVTTTNPSTKYKLTTTFKILSTITASSMKKVKGDSKKFTAKFYKSSGKALSKQYVRVKISGKNHYIKTDSKGQVKLSFNQYKKGTYKVVCYNNDGLSKSNTVQVYSKASTKLATGSYTFLPNDTKVVKIKFTTALDDSSKSGKTIKISIGGKTYSKKTDSKGEINFKLPELQAGLYGMTCSYGGNKFFKSSSKSSYMTILDTSDVQFNVESATSFGDFAGTPLTVSLTAGGVPLIKKSIVFTVNGTDYGATTNYYGTASVPIYLDVGNYTIHYRSFEDSKVNAGYGECEINVFERTTTNITCTFKNTYTDSSQTFTIHLTDFNATPIAFEDVEFVIDGETYYGMTNANGYASFKVKAAVGKYNVSVLFRGNNEYAPSTLSNTINIKISKYSNGLNEKNSIASGDYLKTTKNCQVTNSKIKSLVKSLTKGLTSDLDKARAIFNYVRDNIYYAYYYDTHKGAVGTLTSKSGNCVDQAHLLVAMYRAAGFKARYVHGKCKFYDDGEFYGHVWTQVLIGKTWIVGDPIDDCNKLGKINNWNTKNYKLWNKYASLPF